MYLTEKEVILHTKIKYQHDKCFYESRSILKKAPHILDYYCNKCFWTKFNQWTNLYAHFQANPLIKFHPKTFIAIIFINSFAFTNFASSFLSQTQVADISVIFFFYLADFILSFFLIMNFFYHFGFSRVQ